MRLLEIFVTKNCFSHRKAVVWLYIHRPFSSAPKSMQPCNFFLYKETHFSNGLIQKLPAAPTYVAGTSQRSSVEPWDLEPAVFKVFILMHYPRSYATRRGKLRLQAFVFFSFCACCSGQEPKCPQWGWGIVLPEAAQRCGEKRKSPRAAVGSISVGFPMSP